MATSRPSTSFPLYTTPKLPEPISLRGEKLFVADANSENVKLSVFSMCFEDDPLLLNVLELCLLLENDLMVVEEVVGRGKASTISVVVSVGCTELSAFWLRKRHVPIHRQYRIEHRPTKPPTDPMIRNITNSLVISELGYVPQELVQEEESSTHGPGITIPRLVVLDQPFPQQITDRFDVHTTRPFLLLIPQLKFDPNASPENTDDEVKGGILKLSLNLTSNTSAVTPALNNVVSHHNPTRKPTSRSDLTKPKFLLLMSGVPTEEGEAAGAEAAEEAPAAGDGLEGDVGKDLESLPVLVALDPLGGLAGDNAAYGAGAEGDGDGGGGAEAVHGGGKGRRKEWDEEEEEEKEDGDEGEGEG
ncbi:putative serine/threonine-protein kinase-like protein CCR3 [Senna tora]|uniref:Putative serine/threonine-protein kinase-like protein CCR3 n=1 Tax=Senna tora TaxID=362788 RepID=A0A834T8M6_9FABA|nr:putative serine/threonine-protein kinase-like protein CCR3 [Senna tora]